MGLLYYSTYSFCLLFLFSLSRISAQSQSSLGASFTCTGNSPPCDTYVTYVVQSLGFRDLKSISDLFGVNTSSISKASNLISEGVKLIPGQLLLVPLTCGCNGSHYFTNVTYSVKRGDNYYLLSLYTFQNLTDQHVMEDTNPTLNLYHLPIGVQVVFPLFCGCPSKSQSENGIKYLITYVWQPNDDTVRVGAKFSAREIDIVTENNHRNFAASAGSPVLIPVSQIPAISQHSPQHKHQWITVAAICSAGAVLIVLVAFFLFYALGLYEKRKNLKHKNPTSETKQGKLLPGVSGYLGKLTVYDIKIIMEATMNLNEVCRIGGSVYKAMIGGKTLVVKKAKDTTEELNILQKVNHGNLVNLLGMSIDGDGSCILVYEFAENGSLDRWLNPNSSTPSSSTAVLSWSQRLRIALDIANGLQYMHEHTQPSIVHGDIRASNVLLDSKLKAKISNFSKARPAENSRMLKADVFGFGVVLSELLSGRLWKEAREVSEGGERVREWVDPKLEGLYPIEGAMNLMALAKACTQERPSSRPRMGEIVFSLSVLSQSFSSQTPESSWACTLEGEEVPIIAPIIAR